MTGEQMRQLVLADDLAGIARELPLDPALIDWIGPEGCKLSFVAAQVGRFETLKYLVEYGLKVNLNDRDATGRDLLHFAALSGDVEKCRYLVERCGMDPMKGDHHMHTPFDIAHEMGFADLEAYFVHIVGAAYEQTYHNPVRSGFFPDPSVVRVGEDFYMVNSTFVFFPCIPVSHSRDLVHWEVIGHAIERPEWANVEGLEGGRGWWAPDISYCNGKFYITATLRLNDEGAVRRRQMVVSADRPEGPYSEPAFIEEDGIDPSIFHDDDGRHYMLLNRGARIFELDETCTCKISEPRMLYYGTQKRAPEGPHLLKHNGWYYLFEAEGGTGMGHRETVARSRELMGPYTPCPWNPIIRQQDEHAVMQRCGHAKPVSLPDGRWCFVYLCGRTLNGKWTLLGRETALDPFIWSPDGWPILNAGRGPSSQNAMPLPAASVPERVDWLTPRPPMHGEISWAGDRLTIHGSHAPMTDVACRSVLLRRQTSFCFRFAANVHPAHTGDAGITCYYDEHSFLTFGLDAGVLTLTVNDGDVITTTQYPEIETDAWSEIRLYVQTDGLSRTFGIEREGRETPVVHLENVTCLADEGVKVGKRFTGAMVGLYALRETAQFTEMTYSTL